MQILLLLSAILTALTGAVSGTRAEDPQQLSAHSVAAFAQSAAQPAKKAIAGLAVRPAVKLRAVLSLLPATTLPVAIAVALYTDRRRE